MPDYRKRKHSKLSSSPNRIKKSRIAQKNPSDDIKMSPSGRGKRSTTSSDMKVVKGRKLEKKRKFKIGAVVTAIIICAFLILQVIFPAGIIETLSTATALLGTGSYPIELESNETVNVMSSGSYYYILSNTHINAVSNSGKQLFSYNHGYENPVLKVSSWGALVFEQGGTEGLLFNAKKLKSTVKTEKPILSGAISDSGRYALATLSDKYASSVSVYSKNGDIVYEWYSAKDIVNNVLLSSNGKKLAVSTFDSSGGQYSSAISVLGFESATPLHTEKFENTLVYTLDGSFRSRFAVVTDNKIKYIKWRGFKSSEYKSEYSTAFFRTGKGGYVTVFNRENDKTDNKITVFSKYGKQKAEFNYKGVVSDIAVYGNHIYCMNDTEIFLLDTDGKVLRKGVCGFGAVRFIPVSTNSVIVFTDNKIESIKLE